VAYVKDITHAASEAGYWATQARDFDSVLTDSALAVVGCSRVTLKWKRTVPTGLSEDLMMCTLSIAKDVGGHLYGYVPLIELAPIETLLDGFMTTVKAQQHSSITLVEYSWHVLTQNSPRDKTGRGQKAGPAVRVTTKSTPGTASVGRSPDQLATNLTIRTASRKHWGRIALPGIDIGKWDPASGRLLNSSIDLLSGAFDGLHNNLVTAGYRLGVWSQLHPTFMTASQLEVDDVPDIQRRRRPKRRNYAKIYP
jgi:hypothetical protein